MAGLTIEQKKAIALATARAKVMAAAAPVAGAAAAGGVAGGEARLDPNNPEQLLQALERSGYKRKDFERVPAAAPGPAKDPVAAVGDAATAFQAGANQGMTLGFGDEIAAGMMAPITAIGPALEGKGYDIGKAYGDNVEFVRDRVAADRAKNEGAAVVGDIVGAAIPITAAGATQVGGKLLGITGSLPSRVLAGSGSGGLIAGIDTLGRGGTIEQAIENAKRGALIGLGLPIVGAAAKAGVAAATGKAFDPAEMALARALDADGIPVDQVNARLAAKGPDAVLADLGPNLQRQAGALASLPGEAQSLVRGALAARAAGTNSRIIADVDATLGPAPIPSREAATIRANQEALGPEYDRVFTDKALSPDFEFDPSIVGNAIDTAIPRVVGQTQSRLDGVRRMLIDPDTGQYTTNPSIVFEVRKELDALLKTETNVNAARELEHIRRVIDEDLGAQVAGLKNVDAKYAELARQNEALTTGQQLLDSGRTAVRPAELETMVQEGALPQGQMVGPSAVPFRLSQGTRAEIERIIGTTANDLNALKTALKGDGSWNRDRLATLYGQERADRLLGILEREKDFDATNRIVSQNSETAARKAAQAEFDGGMPQVTRDITVPGLIAMGAQKLANVGARTRRAATNAAVADALMSRQLDPAMLTAVQRALAQRQKPVLFAPAIGSLALTGPGG